MKAVVRFTASWLIRIYATENRRIFDIRNQCKWWYNMLSFISRSTYKMPVFFSYVWNVTNIINANCCGLTCFGPPCISHNWIVWAELLTRWHSTDRLCVHSAYRSDNFIIGLTNVSPLISPPVLGQYSVCGQYPGAVPSGATVSLQCDGPDLPPARYVIVQFDMTDHLNFCELNVCAEGRSDLSPLLAIIFFYSVAALRSGSLDLFCYQIVPILSGI